jgi:Flp pilus assembly protein TadB
MKTPLFSMLSFGIALIVFSILIFLHPELIAYFVASILFFIGTGICATAIALKPQSHDKKILNEFEKFFR